MSAPETNIERQKRRHWGPLVGIAVVLGFAAVITVWYLGVLAANGNDPTEPGVPADVSNGAVEQVE